MTPRVREDEVTIAALSVAELYPESSSLIDGVLGEVGWGTEVLAMEREGEETVKRKANRQGRKWWDLMCTVVPSLICAVNDSVVIRFPRKKDIFLFQLPAGYRSGIEKPKDSGVWNILKPAA
jgi:hypothetical protein